MKTKYKHKLFWYEKVGASCFSLEKLRKICKETINEGGGLPSCKRCRINKFCKRKDWV